MTHDDIDLALNNFHSLRVGLIRHPESGAGRLDILTSSTGGRAIVSLLHDSRSRVSLGELPRDHPLMFIPDSLLESCFCSEVQRIRHHEIRGLEIILSFTSSVGDVTLSFDVRLIYHEQGSFSNGMYYYGVQSVNIPDGSLIIETSRQPPHTHLRAAMHGIPLYSENNFASLSLGEDAPRDTAPDLRHIEQPTTTRIAVRSIHKPRKRTLG